MATIERDCGVVGVGILLPGSIWKGMNARYAKLSWMVCVGMAIEEVKVGVRCPPNSYGSVRCHSLYRYHSTK